MTADPIADFLIRLKNASSVRHERVVMPFSSMKYALAKLLSKEGYVGSVKKNAAGTLQIELRYGGGEGEARPAIAGARRLSKPSRRFYIGVRDIRPVKHGRGLLVLSTPKGVMTGGEARKQRVGGETLFEIW